MSRKFLFAVPLFVISTVLAADTLAEKFQKKIDTAETAFRQAVTKADNARFYAVQKATTEKVKVLKQVLTETTKAGDFDAATKIKDMIAASEAVSGLRPRPKDGVKVGGHEYALIQEKTTWHVAKRLCEEMGGHLACLESPGEVELAKRICGDNQVWIGATDEVKEADWKWVTGAPVNIEMRLDNNVDADHWLALYHGDFHDGFGGSRVFFLCEWEN